MLRGGIVLLVATAGAGWLDVPYVRQVKAGCGSAAVAMIVQYWARQDARLRPAAERAERIDELLPAPSAKGIPGQALKRYFEQEGFAAYVFRGERRDLEEHLGKGRPVMVCLALNGARGPYHYAVVVGLEADAVRLNDPARGRLYREELPRFMAAWQATGNWALLAVPRPAP